MNLFRLSIADSTVSLGDWQILLPRAVVGTAAEVIIGVRPEHLELGGAGIEMDVDMVEELGADAYLYGRIVSGGCEMDQSIVARVDGRGPPERVVACGYVPHRDTCTSSPSTGVGFRANVALVSTARVDLVCEGGGVGDRVGWSGGRAGRCRLPISQGGGQQRGCDRRVAGRGPTNGR